MCFSFLRDDKTKKDVMEINWNDYFLFLNSRFLFLYQHTQCISVKHRILVIEIQSTSQPEISLKRTNRKGSSAPRDGIPCSNCEKCCASKFGLSNYMRSH